MRKNPKESFLKRFEERHTIKRIFGQSFYELNSTAILYFRYSKAHNDQFFYGVESNDLSAYRDKNLFILFICETEDQIIVLPFEDFEEMVKRTEPVSNQWKVFITKRDRQYSFRVAGKGKYDVTKNLNQFDFRPREFRTTVLPTIGSFIPLGRKKEPKQNVEQQPGFVQRLEDRLIASSSDSKHPTVFERTVAEVFEKFGFKVKHVGGAGNTDIVLESPIRGIIDCKSCADDALHHLNFSRLKRHKQENDASFLVVVSKGFDRAVVRDAEMERCTLLPVTLLKELFILSESFTLSPFEIEPIFEKGGIVTNSDLEQFRQRAKVFKEKMSSLVRVIAALDFKARDLKEIKGRLDYEAEEKSRSEIKEEELQEFLNFLSSPLVSIVYRKDGTYSARYGLVQSLHKFKIMFRELISPAGKE